MIYTDVIYRYLPSWVFVSSPTLPSQLGRWPFVFHRAICSFRWKTRGKNNFMTPIPNWTTEYHVISKKSQKLEFFGLYSNLFSPFLEVTKGDLLNSWKVYLDYYLHHGRNITWIFAFCHCSEAVAASTSFFFGNAGSMRYPVGTSALVSQDKSGNMICLKNGWWPAPYQPNLVDWCRRRWWGHEQ